MDREIVYVGMVGDMLHAGHINILNRARALGRVVVGVLTDTAVADYKRVPFLSFEERVKVVESIGCVEKVVAQETLSYRSNLLELRPRYVVHGDDWRYGDKVAAARQEVLSVLSGWGGELVEVPYTKGVSSTLINHALEEDGVFARRRQAHLRRLLEVKSCLRIMEAHNALSAVVAHRAQHEGRVFDALWQSSFTDSAQRGKPDIEIVDHSARIATVNEIFDATPLPLIYDGDTGGSPERVFELARHLDRAGVSALCLEDKSGAKHNSLYGQSAPHQQATIEEFCGRIRAAKRAIGGGMLFIARIESFVLGTGLEDALIRADAYVAAGADALLIHSVAPTADEVISFAAAWNNRNSHIPIFVVPTTYGGVGEQALSDAGIKGIIYANHLLRASYLAMVGTAGHILRERRSDDDHLGRNLAAPRDILELFPREQ